MTLQGGQLTLTGNNTYAGLTTVNGATLNLSSTGGPALGGNLLLSGGAVQLLRSNQLPGTGSVSISDGVFDIGAANQTLAAVHLSGGAIAGSTAGVLTSTADVDAQNGTISAILAGAAGLAKTTAGTVVLSGANTYSGTTSVSAGNLTLAHPLALQNSTVNMAGGALGFAAGNTAATFGGLTGNGNIALTTAASEPVSLSVGNNSQDTKYGGTLSGPGGLVKVGGGVLTLSASQSYAGPTVISGGTLRLPPGGGGAAMGIQFVGNGSAISGADGVLPISNWNSLTGTSFTNVALINSSSALTSAVLNASAGGTYSTGNSDQLLNGYVYGSGVFNPIITGIPYSSYDVYVYLVDSSSNSDEVSVGNAAFYYQSLSTNPFTQITNTTPNTYPGGNYVLVQGLNGSTLSISTSSSTGDYGLSGIELVNTGGNGANVLPVTTPVTIQNGSTLDMTNIAQTVLSLSSTDGMGSQVLVGSGGLTITGPAVTTFDGVISGGGGTLAMQAGQLTLTGSNTYTGSTTVNGGTLQLGTGAANQDGSINATGSVANNGALVYNLAASQTASYAISGSGSLTKIGTGTLTLSNPSNGYSGATNINSGLLVIAPGSSALGQGPLNLSGGSLDVEGNSPLVNSLNGFGTIGNGASGPGNSSLLIVANGGAYSGTIRDGGFGGNSPMQLALLGGTLTLSGSNTFTGGTTVVGGELILANSQALADGSSLTVGDPGLFPAPVVPAAVASAGIAAVPEPGSLAILAVAGAAAAAVARKRRRRGTRLPVAAAC